MGRNDRRPEESAPPEIFYNDTEARKYTDNSRIIKIQTALTERALELLALPDDGTPKLLLDLGCGSGLSGETLTEHGHVWVVRNSSCSMFDPLVRKWGEGPRGGRSSVDKSIFSCAYRVLTSVQACWRWQMNEMSKGTCVCMI